MASAHKGPGERLRKEAVLRLLGRMQDDLSRHQLERLGKLAALIDDDGRIGLEQALEAATPGGDDQRRQAAFRQFRRTVADAAEAAQVTLALVPDTLKVAPVHRFCWFEGEDEDPVLGELAEMSKDKSRRRGRNDTVEPRVSQVRPLAPIRVHVCAARASEDRLRAGKVEEFIELLRRDLRTGEFRDIQVTATDDIKVGLPEAGERARLWEQADIVIALLTPAYLDQHESEIAELADRCPVGLLPVTFAALPGAEIHHLGLRRNRIMLESSPYDSRQLRGREQFVAEVAAAIRRLLDTTLENPTSPAAAAGTAARDHDYAFLERVSKLTAASRPSTDVKVDPRASEIGLDPASVGLAAGGRFSPARGKAVPAVDRLVGWASSTGPDAPRLCALLGDLGMGKTTTAKLFTERLLGLRGKDSQVPVPVLFDLRDISVTALPAQPTLKAVVTQLLDATGDAAEMTADQVLAAIAGGNCLVIFDGLDEVLVHLDPQQGQLFVRALWQVIDLPGRAGRLAERHTADAAIRPTRLLLTCRTHYFRSVRDEVGSFTGQGRDGPAGRDYLALLMLPFGEEQVRAYLKANVPGMDVDSVLALMDSVHNLRELTERPLTLSYITEQLEFIERAKLDGRTIRPADMYGAMVERWLARDQGKHVLLPEHKLVIMEALAAKLWRAHRASWSVGDLEQWLLEFLADRPDLELHYGQRRPELWKEDLRTATFLIRRGDDKFSFAHTSLLEYFLSRYLLRALRLGADDLDELVRRWMMPLPSQETLDFLGQGLASLAAGTWQTCRRALTALAAGYHPKSSEAAFAYGLAAAQAGHPHHRLAGTRLPGADLRAWQIAPQPATLGAGQGTDPLDLSGVVLNGANLTDSRFDRIDLRGADLTRADLTRALITRSDLRDADLTDSVLVGTILRSCRIHGARTATPTTHRAQALLCEPAGIPDDPGWLRGPLSTGSVADKGRLVALTGHAGAVWSVAYQPDGTRLATAGVDGTVRIWDTGTGEQLHALTGHTGAVWSVAYQPDGTRLATAGDGTVRIWDTGTGEQLHALTGHAGTVWSVAYQPDGTRLATAGGDGTVRIWDTGTGEQLHALTGHTVAVLSVAYQPDGTRLATAGDDGTVRIWDTGTGEQLHALTGHAGTVWSVAYQPDGTRLATAGDDGTVRIWDTGTGEQLHALTGHAGTVWSVAYQPDGTRLATADGVGTVRIWDTGTGEQLHALTGHAGTVWSVAYQPDGTRLATAGDGTVRIWDTGTGEQLHALTGHAGAVWSVAYQPDGTRLATAGGDGTVRIWDTGTGRAAARPDRARRNDAVGGLPARRHPPRHRQRRRHGADLGYRHR